MAVARDSLVSFERVIKSAFVKSQVGNESYMTNSITKWNDPVTWLLGDGALYSIERDRWPLIWFILEGLLRSEKTEKILDKFNFPFIKMYFPGKMIVFFLETAKCQIMK